MTCDFRDTSNALSMQMRGKFIEKDLRAFSQLCKTGTISTSGDGGGGGRRAPQAERTPEPRLGGRQFRVCSMQDECPDSGSF